MTALAPIPPETLRRLLEKYGFIVKAETEYNWTLFKEDAPYPVIPLPKDGAVVSVTVMMGILDKLKMDNGTFLKLLSEL